MKDFRSAFLHTLPVMTGYLVLGAGFGILMYSSGFGLLPTAAMSVFIYAGSMQYLGVSLLTGGASLASVAVTTFMVNARHLLYGITMSEKYRRTGRKKPYLVFALTDETFSLVCSTRKDTDYCFLVSLLDHLYWVAGSVAGSLIGSVLPFGTEGIDFALTALFLTIFTEQWLTAKDHFPALLGVGASVLCLVIFGADRFLIPGMALIVIGALLYGRRERT